MAGSFGRLEQAEIRDHRDHRDHKDHRDQPRVQFRERTRMNYRVLPTLYQIPVF